MQVRLQEKKKQLYEFKLSTCINLPVIKTNIFLLFCISFFLRTPVESHRFTYIPDDLQVANTPPYTSITCALKQQYIRSLTLPKHPVVLPHFCTHCRGHSVTADTRCLAAAWHLKPPWQRILTLPSPLPIPPRSSSSPSSPHHQADLNPSSPRPWHSRLPLPAPGTEPTCQPPDSTEDEWIAENFAKNHWWLTSRLIIVLANCLRYQFETISMGCDEWDNGKQSKD